MRQRVMIAMAIANNPEGADRRRTDDRARRHGAGADRRACCSACRNESGGARADHARSRRGRRRRRPVAVMYAGTNRRNRRGRRYLRRLAPSLYARAACLPAADRGAGTQAGADPGHVALLRRAAVRMSVPSALSRLRADVCRGRSRLSAQWTPFCTACHFAEDARPSDPRGTLLGADFELTGDRHAGDTRQSFRFAI